MARERTIIGVDFSASRSAGETTWISEGVLHDETLLIRLCGSAERRFGSREREDVMDGLVEMVRQGGECVVGFDFPFGVPADVVDEPSTWVEFIEEFDLSSPDEFKTHHESKAEGEQLPRATERRTGGQCAYGHRIRYQSFYGIDRVVKPLLEEEIADFPPMVEEGRDAIVLETYPAAVLEEMGAERTGYKKQKQEAHDTRKSNVETLEDLMVFDDQTRRYALADENALDSLVAAYATAEAVLDGFACNEEYYDPVEGHIFA